MSADRAVVEAVISQVYRDHGHPDDWGVPVIYEAQMVEYLTAALTAVGAIRDAAEPEAQS